MYVFDKPEPIVLPIIPYPKFIPIIVNLFPSHYLLYVPILFFDILVHQPMAI